jgi:enediyne polyketide synthase
MPGRGRLGDHEGGNETLPLDPRREMYGGVLFQTGRFARVQGYRLLRATESLAVVAGGPDAEWFGPYVPAALVLGDPGARDAFIHSIQACVPHATLLPTAVRRIVPGDLGAGGPWTVHARERLREGDRFVYDLEVAGQDGRILERWEGLDLRALPGDRSPDPWPWPLLGPYLERRAGDLLGGPGLRVALMENGSASRAAATELAVSRALGRAAALSHGSNGRPEIAAEPGVSISASHSGRMTLAIEGAGPVGCDVESVVTRPEGLWRELLGCSHFELARRLAQESATDFAVAATRVWAAHECLRKAGWIGDVPLLLSERTPDGWTVFASGSLGVATYAPLVGTARERIVLALLSRRVDGGV